MVRLTNSKQKTIVENIEEIVEDVAPQKAKIVDTIGEKLNELKEAMNAKGYFKCEHRVDFERILEEELDEVEHLTVEEFNKVGKFEKGKAILSTGENYTGYIIKNVKKSEYAVDKYYLKYQDGQLVRSIKVQADSRYMSFKNYTYNNNKISNVENWNNYYSYSYCSGDLELAQINHIPEKGIRNHTAYSNGKLCFSENTKIFKDENGIFNKQEISTSDYAVTSKNYIKNSENKFEEVSMEHTPKGADYTEYSDKTGIRERRYNSGAKDVYIKDELAEADAYIPKDYRIGERQKYEVSSVAKIFDEKGHHTGYRRVILQHASWDHDFYGRPSEWQTNTITEILDKDKNLVKSSFVEGERFDRRPLYD